MTDELRREGQFEGRTGDPGVIVARLHRALNVFLRGVRTMDTPPGRERECAEMIDDFEREAHVLLSNMQRAVNDSDFERLERSLSVLGAAFGELRDNCSEHGQR